MEELRYRSAPDAQAGGICLRWNAPDALDTGVRHCAGRRDDLGASKADVSDRQKRNVPAVQDKISPVVRSAARPGATTGVRVARLGASSPQELLR